MTIHIEPGLHFTSKVDAFVFYTKYVVGASIIAYYLGWACMYLNVTNGFDVRPTFGWIGAALAFLDTCFKYYESR